MHFGRCKNKYYVRWWFFEGFKKCVKSTYRKHMNFVDYKYSIFADGRLKMYAFFEVADFVNTIVRGGVHFYNINVIVAK